MVKNVLNLTLKECKMLKIIIFVLFWVLTTVALRMGDMIAIGLSLAGFLVLFTIAEEFDEREK